MADAAAWEETKEYKELSILYEKAESEGLFVFEIGGSESSHLASVGRIIDLEQAGYTQEDIPRLGIGDVMGFSVPANGKTRKKAVKKAISEYKKYSRQRANPDPNKVAYLGDLDLYGSFEEGGYTFKAFMPANDSQPRQWTIEVYKSAGRHSDQKEPVLVEQVPMLYAPIFGPDADDVAMLEKKAAEIIERLPVAEAAAVEDQ